MNDVVDMRTKILDEAGRLAQTFGYVGFSYADVADSVGIRKASIHHHFPTKADLGLAMIQRFRSQCREAVETIDHAPLDPPAKLRAYVKIFRTTLEADGRMCLCGMLAAGYRTLPEPVRAELLNALSDHESWLEGVIRQGRRLGKIRKDRAVKDQARTFFCGLEGAMMVARAREDPRAFDSIAASLLSALEPTGS